MSKFIIGTCICLCLSLIGVAQQAKNLLYVTGKIKVEQGIVDYTQIQVFRNNVLLNTIEVNSTGNFRIGLEINQTYKFNIGKKGYYNKTIEVDTRVPKEVCNDNCNFPPYQLSVLLYKNVPGVKEISSQVGRISYNPKVDNFDAEMLRNTETQTDAQKVLEQIKAQSKQYEQQTTEATNNKYRQAITDADQLSKEKKYKEAMLRYRDALMIHPEIDYPRNRVNQLYQLMVAEELDKAFGVPTTENFIQFVNYGDKKFAEKEFSMAKMAYERALKAKPADATISDKLYKANSELMSLNDLAITEVKHRKTVYVSRTNKYNELISKGDTKFLTGDFAEAKDFFAQAAMQIDENSYSLLMIKKIDEMLGSDEAALKLAKEREEAERQKLREARNKAYADAITEADRLFTERLYRDAQEYYELALTVKDFEQYPQQQLRIIKGILAEMQLKGEEYNNLLRDAETNFTSKKYPEARGLFVKAHELIPTEKFALARIKIIDELLLKLKDEEKHNEQYNNYLKIAQQHTDNKQYNQAIVAYQDALKLKPSEEFPKIKIKELRDLLSRESDAQKKAIQKQTDYEKFIALADDAFNRQSYAPARSWYQEALNTIPNQEYPQSQIRKIDNILKEKQNEAKAKSKLDQIDFSKLENVTEDLRKAAYDEAMQLGNSFIQTEEWGLARFYFRRALALYPADAPATQKLSLVDAKIRGGNVDEAKFNELIIKADEAFKTGDFSVSKFYYAKAKEIKPDHAYTLERLQIVSKLAENTASRNANDEYTAALSKGDEAMAINNYAVARFFYRKALGIKPNDETAKSKLAKVESMITK